MKVAQREEAQQLLKDAAELNLQIEAALGFAAKDIRARAEEAATSTAPVLFATLGAGLGGVGAAWATYALDYALFVTGPIGLILGAALGVLIYRGPKYIALERSLEKLDMALTRIGARLASLPPDAPADVRDQLWNSYRELSARYTTLVESGL
jgi:threonine dehydrogenase-like Zn-dependent dehydrogenase